MTSYTCYAGPHDGRVIEFEVDEPLNADVYITRIIEEGTEISRYIVGLGYTLRFIALTII